MADVYGDFTAELIQDADPEAVQVAWGSFTRLRLVQAGDAAASVVKSGQFSLRLDLGVTCVPQDLLTASGLFQSPVVMGSGAAVGVLEGSGVSTAAPAVGTGYLKGFDEWPDPYQLHRFDLSTGLVDEPVMSRSLGLDEVKVTTDTWTGANILVTAVSVPDDSATPPAPGEPPRFVSHPIKAMKRFSLLMTDLPGRTEPATPEYSPWPVEQDPYVAPNLGVNGDPGEDLEEVVPPTQPDPETGEAPTSVYYNSGYFKVTYKSGGPTSTAEGYHGAVTIGIKDIGARFGVVLIDGKYFLRQFTTDTLAINFTPNNVARESTGKQWWMKLEAKYEVMDSTGTVVAGGLRLTTVRHGIMKPRTGPWYTELNSPSGYNECQHLRASIKGWQLTVECEDMARMIWPIQPLGAGPAQSPWIP